MPALESRYLIWDLANFLDAQQYMEAMDNPNERLIAERVFTNFRNHVVPKIPIFSKGIVHGDTNGGNILVKKKEDSDEYELAGVIDFGNCVLSCCIFDLGILLAYSILENNPTSPFEFITPVLCGYVSEFPFESEELASLYYIIMARLCQSAVIRIHTLKNDPWSASFLKTIL